MSPGDPRCGIHVPANPNPTTSTQILQQWRTLTVVEAARLETFPDNYLFKGTGTEQYVRFNVAVASVHKGVASESENQIL